MRANPARALLPHLLITADVDDLGDRAVGRAELYRPRIWLREEGAAIGDDLLDKAATLGGRISVSHFVIAFALLRDSGAVTQLRQAKPVEIEMTTIDAFCVENRVVPRLIKIDIEGYEFHALRSASGVLMAHKPTIVMELHPMLWPEIGISGVEAKRSLEVNQYSMHLLSGQTSPVKDYGHVALLPGLPVTAEN